VPNGGSSAATAAVAVTVMVVALTTASATMYRLKLAPYLPLYVLNLDLASRAFLRIAPAPRGFVWGTGNCFV